MRICSPLLPNAATICALAREVNPLVAANAYSLRRMSAWPEKNGAETPMAGLASRIQRKTGWKDAGWAGLWWLHFLIIVALAGSVGQAALNADNARPLDDPTRDTLDFNAGRSFRCRASGVPLRILSARQRAVCCRVLNCLRPAALFVRVIGIACAVSALSSCLMLYVLRRYAGSLITCALYTSLLIQGAMTLAMFMVNPIFGCFMGILFMFTLLYTMWAKKRIPFAAAHVEAAVAVTNAHTGVFYYALLAVFLQAAWVMLWSLAAFGLENNISSATATPASPSTPGQGQSSQPTPTQAGTSGGAAATFFMLLSLLWGVQLLKYTVHFVVADTVGQWWFEQSPRGAVQGAVTRAFTTNFGSLSFAAFVIAFLETAKRFARASQRAARKDNNGAMAALACVAVCIIGCVESMAEYLNSWAIPIMALTGDGFVDSGKEALQLFKARGWDAVINDNLVHDALAIASIMSASASSLAGAALVYAAMPSNSHRMDIAGVAALFCFIVGYCVASLMMGVLVAAVKSIFVAFAMDPSALGATHPQYLQKLVTAWNEAHPEIFHRCGYAKAYNASNGGYGPPPTAYYPGQPMPAMVYPGSPAGGALPMGATAVPMGVPVGYQSDMGGYQPGPVAYGAPGASYQASSYQSSPPPAHSYSGAPMMPPGSPGMAGGYQVAAVGYQTPYQSPGQAGPTSGYPPGM